MGLGASHIDSDTDTNTDADMNRRPGRVKVTPGNYFGDSENEDYGYQKRPNKTNTTQFRVKNDAQDIEAFKRIHNLIEEKKNRSIDQANDRIWNTSPQEERERIKEFWLGLGAEERSSLVKVEKAAVLRKIKEQQKHSCSCRVCGQKRKAIEEELEVLYDAYYEELEQYSNHHVDGQLPPKMGSSYGKSKGNLDEYQERDEYSIEEEEEDDEDEWSEDKSEEGSRPFAGDFFNFGSSLTVQGGILTVADDLLKNDGKKFIEMMEHLAERRMAREEEAEAREQSTSPNSGYPQNSPTSYGSPSGSKPDNEDSEDIEEEENDSWDDEYEEGDMKGNNLTPDQRMEEGRRMFQIFAARMFEQRVLTAYKEKVSLERQAKLQEELADEEFKKLRE